MRFGAHVSRAGGLLKALDRALASGCECFQVFSRNPRRRREEKLDKKTIKEFKQKTKNAQLMGHFYLHCPYYINLGSSNPKIWHASVTYLAEDLKKAELLGAKGLVMHIGHHRGKGINEGIKRLTRGILQAFKESKSKTTLFLENTSGQGTEFGSTFKEIAEIFQILKPYRLRLSLCFDTCHAFAAGYDLRNKKALEKTLEEFNKIIGLKYLKLIHANDSKRDLGSHLDRHEHIGHGKIGKEGFQALVNHPKLRHLDLIIETPHFGEINWDRKNLEKLKSLVKWQVL